MHVGKLIALLEAFDLDAHVYIMSQPGYPFEYEVQGVAVREDFSDDEEADPQREDVRIDDVFILEGSQLRHGSPKAWGSRRPDY